MIPLLLCAYRPRYLQIVLNALRSSGVEQKYRIFAWDNGGADIFLREAGLEWQCVRDEASQGPINVGKALAMRYLVDAANQALPDADCYVCMDDDIIVDCFHLDALVAAARRRDLGMIGPRMHPFNSVVPSGGTVANVDACPLCIGPQGATPNALCPRCGGLGTDPEGLRLLVFPTEDRTVRKMGRVAGGLFAVSKASVQRLPWTPHLYPILTNAEQKPAVYWTEDASLDFGLTAAGLLNGYLEGAEYTPVIHLPELDQDYVRWKAKARNDPLATPAFPF